ncbi:MAG: hypothetical protein U0O22_00085 [Acutalibacteraceae bacterium]
MLGNRPDGSLIFDTRVDSNGFNRGVRNITGSIGSLRSMLGRLASAIGIAFSVTAVVNFGKTCINAATEVENAWIGLNSIINGQGKSFDNAKKFIQEYISDGLVPLKNAVTAYKNLSLRGYNEEQIEVVMNSLKNSATYARQSQYTLGDAITAATEGLKNENSILVDNAGVTKNVAKMWQDYAKSIGVSSTSLTKQQKIQAEVNGILEETKFQMGDATRYSNSYSGQLARLNAIFTNFKTKIGNILKAVASQFLPIIITAISGLERLVDKTTSWLNSMGIQTDVVSTLTDVSNSADTLTDSIETTTEANEKLKNSLAGFDKLNVLSQAEDKDTGSADGATTTPIQSADVTQANNQLTTTETILDKIKTKLKELSSIFGFDTIFNTLGESVDRMRPTLEKAFSSLLNGFYNLGLSVGEILTDAFNISTENLENWASENQEIIGLFFDNLQGTFARIASFLGGIVGDIADILISWWYNSGQKAFDSICKAFLDVGTTLLNVYNKWIQPVIDCIIGIFTDCWEYALKPIFEQVVSFFGKLMECIATVWSNFLSPIVNWIIDFVAPVLENALLIVRGVFKTVFGYIGDVLSGFIKTLGGVLDFITGIFKGDWKKAWEGIEDIVSGIWDMIWGAIKATINLIIDGINALWTGFYTALSGIVNGIGSIAKTIGEVLGTNDWGWEIPTKPPLIPKLATGTVVPANYGEFMAVLGDNKREPEVVSPLSTMKQAMREVLAEMNVTQNNNGEIVVVLELDGEVLFKKNVQLNNKYKKRHGGKSAFA